MRVGNTPLVKAVHILSTVFAPIGGFITLMFVCVNTYEWILYLAGIEKMDIFANIPDSYKIVGILIGLVPILLLYIVKWYDVQKKKGEMKFDLVYLLAMIIGAGITAGAAWLANFSGLGYFLEGEIESVGFGVMMIAGVTLGLGLLIDKYFIHLCADWTKDRRLRKAAKFFDEKKGEILEKIYAFAKKQGVNLKDVPALRALFESLKKAKFISADSEVSDDDLKNLETFGDV